MSTTAEEIIGSDVEVTGKDGQVIRLGRLSLIEWAQVQRLVEIKHKKELRGKCMMLKEIGLDVELIPAAIRKMTMAATTREIINYMHTPEGAIEVIKIAAAKVGTELPDDFFEDAECDQLDMIQLSVKVANLEMTEDDVDEEKGSAATDPLAATLSNQT